MAALAIALHVTPTAIAREDERMIATLVDLLDEMADAAEN